MKYLNYLFLFGFLLILAVGVISFSTDFSFIKEAELKAAISSVITGDKYGSLLAEKREVELAKAREIKLVIDGKIDSVEPIKIKINSIFQPYIP